MSASRHLKRVACHLVLFAGGYFGLVAQTLLFRDFFTVYEGNELGIAAFFCSWLLCVAVGALLARLPGRVASWLAEHFAFLVLLYIPAYLLHAWLTDWQALWPDEPGNRPSLQHFAALVGALSAVATRRGEMPRLETKLARLLRSHRQQPVSLFCHLGLTALDLWRLRGALVQRAVFAAPGGQGS